MGRGLGTVAGVESSLTAAEQAQIAVDEYRFQVRLNADRINHWYTLTMAMLVAGAALSGLRDERLAPAVVFGATAVTALLCALGVKAQHGYYHAARDRALTALESAGAPELLRTTPGMRKESATRVRVVVIQQWLFYLLAVGAAVAMVVVLRTPPTP